ncbi:MAG TPA: hypothetical protein PLW81_06825 [Thiobacillaceae bacterium]|nr:hypothetical protein [Thiobacillaceae bacterium]
MAAVDPTQISDRTDANGSNKGILFKNSFHGRVKTALENIEPQNRSTFDDRLSGDGFATPENHI